MVLTGAAGALGRRVLPRMVEAFPSWCVVATDRVPVEAPEGVTAHVLDLVVDDVAPFVAGADVVVHLASVLAADRVDDVDPTLDAELARRVLDAAARAGVAHVVVVSSATVYGAWDTNPIPLTEAAPVRPNPGFAFAVAKAELEAEVERFRAARPDATATVLRPTVTVAEDHGSWLARALGAASGLQAGDLDPPAQFLHFDDLASAVVVAAAARLDGPVNVAPDGWISGEALRALAGRPRLRLPVDVAGRVLAARRRLRLSPTPPEALPLTMHPWVVANDRLRAAGWVPSHTNEEAYVAGHPAGPWATLSPKRRQELALGAAAAGLVGLAAGGVAVVRRLRR